MNNRDIQRALKKARNETNITPSDAQKKASNYKKGHLTINGFKITIETPKNVYRCGVDKNGKEWKIKMRNDYGYFLNSVGYDGDHVDVFLGDNFNSDKIFVIDQKIGGKFDESKVMLGFNSKEDAKKAYFSNYEKGWKGFHKITEVNEETFKKWLYDGKKQRKAFSEYKDMKLNKYKDMKINETVNKIVKNILIESQNNRWKKLLASVEQRLANGEDYKDIFDYYYTFDNGFTKVWLNNKCNFINQENKLISNQWFDGCRDFDDNGFAMVWLNGEWNFINQKGRLISNQWFDGCDDFDDNGFAMVVLNYKRNLINKKGKLISNQWFDELDDFDDNGFARVKINGISGKIGKFNFINQKGKLISKQWFDNCRAIYDGIAGVELNGKWNLINQEGKLISNQWFDDCDDFGNVELNGKWYEINRDGELFDTNGNPVNIHENIYKKFNLMKINESKIRYIVNESIKRVLLEDKEQTRLTKIVIKKLYKVAQNYKRLYEDSDWTYLRALMDDLANVPGVRDFNYGGGKYHQNGKEFGESVYKLYTVEIETEFDTIIRGEVYCNFAGTFDDPWSRYDMTVNFWRDSGINESKKYDINEDMYKSIEIKSPKLRKLLKKEGLDDIYLLRCNGAFYVYSNNMDLNDALQEIGNEICVYAFNHQTPEQWLEDIKYMVNKAKDFL